MNANLDPILGRIPVFNFKTNILFKTNPDKVTVLIICNYIKITIGIGISLYIFIS